nr:PREDICTED: SRC kinase signaling inhibitor 1 [Latimeria chalumnae]|eukprot:XP_014340530.1 PREDICTED: SRC kinase signaling inhibitor 1 [Latimeria chalumnae]
MLSADDAEYPREYRTLGNGTRRFSNVGLVHTSERRHTVIAAQSLEALTGMQKAEIERKRDAFMDHLKNKYPQHATALRGQQERTREQQPNYWSFKLTGVLFLQYGEETRRVHITHEINSMDTLYALIAHMFSQKLTMGVLKSPNTAILIKDESRNVFYELEDIRDVQDRSIIKIYRKDPIYGPYGASHMANGDLRREMVYTSRDSSPTRRLNNMPPAPHSQLVSASPPPGLQSSSPSRSRMSYSGGRPPSYAGSPVHHHGGGGGGGGHINLPPPQVVSPSPSAILERRDVKPDEDLGNKNMVLVKNEGLYADPYNLVHEGRLSIASTQSLAGMGDPFAFPGGLYRRGSMRSLSTYSAAALQSDLEESLFKPNTQMYTDSYGTGVGFRMAPSSPQKIADGRMVEIQQGTTPHSPYSGSPSRSSPIRQSLRKDSSTSLFMESPVSKSRNTTSSGAPELFPGPGDRSSVTFGTPLPAKDSETRERMEAMEKQIASLTGLVQSALFRGPESESTNEKPEAANGGPAPATLTTSSARSSMAAPTPTPSKGPSSQPTPITRLQMQLHLHDLQQNASDLRNQLQHLRKLQLQSQDTVKMMLKRAETEISVRVTDTIRKQDDPLQRQRTLVEEERLKYLNEEELIVQQLNDLEKSVEEIQKNTSHNHKLVTTEELEEKVLVLRQLGETLTDLKAQFPSLQSKMRVVLRVEVEAVKFLKEEPHRLDGLLKRCKTITDSLTSLRSGHLNKGVWKVTEDASTQSSKDINSDDFNRNADFEILTSPPLPFHKLSTSTTSVQTWDSHTAPALGSTAHNSPGHSQKVYNPLEAKQSTLTKSRGLQEIPTRRSVDRAVSVEAAERDWEEKRASLIQYSTKDINRLLEETQAELMKAIPDLDFVAKQKNQASSPLASEHKAHKPHHAQKITAKSEPNGRRGSEELTVPRYRTEKPSKSPPPPPPRRSFPSSHGLTTTRTGEVIITSKKEPSSIKKADSEEMESQKPHVKLRRTVSEVARPASTPPIVASGIRDEDDEDRIIAELEVFQRSTAHAFCPIRIHSDLLRGAASPTADFRPTGATVATQGWKAVETYPHDEQQDPATENLPPPAAPLPLDAEAPESLTLAPFQLPEIILTEWISAPASPIEANLDQGDEELPGEPPDASQGPKDDEVEMSSDVPVAFHDHERDLGKIGGETESSEPSMEKAELEKAKNRRSLQESSELFPELQLRSFSDTWLYEEAREASHPGFTEESFQQLGAPSVSRESFLEESTSGSSNDLKKENIAFMITETEIQALSTNEVQDIVKEKGEEVQTLKINGGAGGEEAAIAENTEPVVDFKKGPIIVTFEEPLDIRTAYKRLSTVIEEFDEEFKELMEQDEGNPEDVFGAVEAAEADQRSVEQGSAENPMESCTSEEHSVSSTCIGKEQLADMTSTLKHPVPKPRSFQSTSPKTKESSTFKIKFPKNHLNALTRAIQSGTKTGKKKLQIMVYEEEEKIDKATGMKKTEVSKYELGQFQSIKELPSGKEAVTGDLPWAIQESRADKICKSTCKRMDSLEETIRELESTISEISNYPSAEFILPKNFLTPLATETATEKLESGSTDPKVPSVSESSGRPEAKRLNAKPTEGAPSRKTNLKSKPPLLPKPRVTPGTPKVHSLLLILLFFSSVFSFESYATPL